MSDDVELLDSVFGTQYGMMELPEDGIIELGPRNRSGFKRFATITNEIIKQKAEMPISPFCMMIAGRITGKDKQDFSMIMTGRKGKGKSYSSLRIAQETAKATSLFLRKPPEDFFTLENCCLLEDTDGINKLIKGAGMYQIIIIDDAGVAVGSRDFATQKNKNFNKILSTCRTKRWFVILNLPAKSHIDKQIRELVDCWAKVEMKFHDLGFNLLKIHSVEINENNQNKPYAKRYSFNGKKVGIYTVRSPDKETADEYDRRRELAAQRIIDSALTGDEEPKISKREQHRQDMLTKHSETIIRMINEGESAAAVVRKCPGLSDAMLRTLRAELGV